jgi:ubiquinone biosynthesis protein
VEILQILRKHGFKELVTRSNFEQLLKMGRTGMLPEVDPASYSQSVWERIRHIFEDLGPAYIKFVQLLCFRGDLIPLELVEELEKLNDHVRPFPSERILDFIETELGLPVDKLFESFNEKPIASGSVAQVYEARLHTGEAVAVKVQRPGVAEQVRTDLEIMQDLVGAAIKRVPELNIYNIPTVLDEFAKAIELELDFLHEAANMEQFSHCYGDMEQLYVPICYRRYSSRKVLTMEYIDGIKISETSTLKDNGYDVKLLARRGIDIILRHIFVEGFFHADPHAGNFVVMRDNRLCLLDYGMMGRLMASDKRLLTSMFIGGLLHDSEYLTRHILRVCKAQGKVDEVALEADISIILEQMTCSSVRQENIEDMIKQMVRLFPKHNLSLPANLYLLGRSLILLQNNGGNRLDVELNVAEYVQPFVKKLIANRFDMKKLTKDAAIAVEELAEFSKLIPSEVTDVLDVVKRGDLGIRLKLDGLKETKKSIETAANRLSAALIIASTLIGSSMLLGPDCQRTIFGLPSFCTIGYIVAGIFGLLLVISIFRK